MKRFLLGLCILSAAFTAVSAALAQAAPTRPTNRFLMPQDTVAAYNSGDLEQTLRLVTRDIDACTATKPQRDECVTVLRFAAYILRDMRAWVPGEQFARLALAASEKHLSPDEDDLARSYTALAEHLSPQKKFSDAETMLRKALAVRERAFGPDHEGTALSAITLANHLSMVGRLADSAPFYRQAFAARRIALKPGDPGIAFAGMGEADVLFRLGRLGEAEAVSRKVIPLTLATAEAAAAGQSSFPRIETQITAAAAIAGLANNLAQQGRLDEAEAEARRALEMRRAAVGDKDPYTAFSYGQVARILLRQGRLAAAETMSREAVRIGEDFFRRRASTEVAGLRNDLATILADSGRAEEARPLYEKSLAVYRGLFGENHPDVATGEANLASLQEDAGDLAGARQGYERALASATAVYGTASPRLADAQLALGRVATAQGDFAVGRESFQAALALTAGSQPDSAAALISARALLGSDFLREPARVREGRDLLRKAASGAIARARLLGAGGAEARQLAGYGGLFEAQLRAEYLASGPREAAARETAFAAAQLAMSNEAATTLAKVAASYSRADSPVAELELQRAELQRRRAAAEDTYIALFADADRRPARDAAATERDRIDGDLRTLDRRIDEADPAFADLARPSVITSQEARALLRPGEAVLLVYTAPDATYAFLTTPGGTEWRRSEAFAAAAMKPTVDRLRNGMIEDLRSGQDTFDAEAAHQLYRELIAPFEPSLGETRTLITVANDPVAALPLALLVATPVATPGTRPDYLIDRMAVTSLPALSSLRALRCLLVARSAVPSGCGAFRSTRSEAPVARLDFVGIGAPTLYDLDNEEAGPTEQPSAPAATIARGSADFARAFDGTLADTEFLRGLGKLKGAEEELATVRARFSSARSIVRSGDAATEGAVKSMSELSFSRVVLFSTHGLLASESGIRGEPGLVFTPPAESAKSALDDGLLTASEAARLNLSAEFVALSACNTATTEGQANSEGLSSLARAFFFAGARSLLVSHWYVSDDSTSALMADLFARDAAKVGRGAALRQAMLAVRADERWRNPAYWAAFSLVGTPD